MEHQSNRRVKLTPNRTPDSKLELKPLRAARRRGSGRRVASAAWMVMAAVVAVSAVAAALLVWARMRSNSEELAARDALRGLKAIVGFNPTEKHVETLTVRENLAEVLPHIAKLHYLTQLNLADTQLNDADLDHLVRLRRLRSLDLSNTNITDDGVQMLTDLPLESLYLINTQITGDALQSLQHIRSLQIVDLSGTAVQTDIDALTHLPKLEWLLLKGVDLSQTSDATLDQLAEMPVLRRIDLTETGLSSEAIERLKAAKPQLMIDRQPDGGEGTEEAGP